MNVRIYALVMGIIFTILGIGGFIPGLVTYRTVVMPDMTVHSGMGYLFGIFPVNVLHNLFHLLFGIWGLVAYTTFSSSRVYARSVAVIYGILTLMGLFPGLNTFFGLIPLWGHDVWLHALIAVSAAIFGWAPVTRTRYDRVTEPRSEI